MISAARFSGSGELLVVAGADRWLRVFKVGGDSMDKVLGTLHRHITRNVSSHRLSHSFVVPGTCFKEMPISDARLLGPSSSEVLVCGRKPFFYSYDLESGVVNRVPGE
jgi:hypothetical protein